MNALASDATHRLIDAALAAKMNLHEVNPTIAFLFSPTCPSVLLPVDALDLFDRNFGSVLIANGDEGDMGPSCELKPVEALPRQSAAASDAAFCPAFSSCC